MTRKGTGCRAAVVLCSTVQALGCCMISRTTSTEYTAVGNMDVSSTACCWPKCHTRLNLKNGKLKVTVSSQVITKLTRQESVPLCCAAAAVPSPIWRHIIHVRKVLGVHTLKLCRTKTRQHIQPLHRQEPWQFCSPMSSNHSMTPNTSLYMPRSSAASGHYGMQHAGTKTVSPHQPG